MSVRTRTLIGAFRSLSRRKKALQCTPQVERHVACWEQRYCETKCVCFSSQKDNVASKRRNKQVPIGDTLQERTRQWLNVPLGQWQSHQVTRGHAILMEWLRPPHSEENALGASQVLNRWLKECITGNPVAVKNVNILAVFRQVIKYWKRARGSLEFAHEATELLQLLEEVSSVVQGDALQPGDCEYSMVIHAFATQPHDPDTPDQAEALLKQRLAQASGGFVHEAVWNSCLDVLAKCSPYNDTCPERAESLLKLMAQHNSSGHVISATSLSCVLSSWAKSERKGAARRVETILEEMLHKPNIVTVDDWCFNICIDAHARSGEKNSGQRAQDLLWKMEQLYQGGMRHLQPDTVCYSSVMNAWAKSREPHAAEKAEELLNRMYSLYEGGNTKVRPTTECYGAALDAWSKSRDKNAAQRAEALLKRMERLYNEGDALVRPTSVCYVSVISAWANSGEPRAAERAETILRQMEELPKAGRAELAPCTISFTATIHAWSKSPARDAVHRAMALLRKMQMLQKQGNDRVSPNNATYNAVISAAATHGQAKLANDLLQEMNDHTGADVSPDTVSYSSVIHAYAKSKEEGSAERATALLETMENQAHEGNDSVKPNTVTYTSTINCWANSRDPNAGYKAEGILWRMNDLYKAGDETVKPNTVTLNSAIRVWSSRQEAEAPERAETLLRWMETEYRNGNHDVKPDVFSFNHVLFAWAKSRRKGAMAKMERLLKKMEQQTLDGHHDVEPNVISYNHVINALRYADDNVDSNKAERCYNILKQLLESCKKGSTHLCPNTRTFHLVLDACTKCSTSEAEALRMRAMQIAQEVISIMQTSNNKSWRPNSNTYIMFFRACEKLGNTNHDCVQEVFQQCRSDDKVNRGVMNALKQAVPANMFHELSKEITN